MPQRVIPLAHAGMAPGAGPRLTVMPPLTLYVHFPWCVKKCPYCDFNSHAVRDGIPEKAYLEAMVADLEAALPKIWGRRVVSVFIGGGTPSLMSPEGADHLLTAIRTRVTLVPEAEITLEANPGTVEAGRFAAFRAAGVNRLSLGIQSFNDGHLAALGRIHDSREARSAIEIARTHFANVNLDLMYALPRQSLREALDDLEVALGCAPQHLSCYHLTLEPNTAFHHSPPPLPDEDTAARMQEEIEARLADAGYVHYETSAFAQPGRRCHHNMNYWTFGDYLGIGAGAHGKLSSAERIWREVRPRHPEAYMEAVAAGRTVQEERTVDAGALPFEFMMNALRLLEGVTPRLFELRTGLPLAVVQRELQEAREQGLLEDDPQTLRPTPRGQRFLNDLLQIFLD